MKTPVDYMNILTTNKSREKSFVLFCETIKVNSSQWNNFFREKRKNDEKIQLWCLMHIHNIRLGCLMVIWLLSSGINTSTHAYQIRIMSINTWINVIHLRKTPNPFSRNRFLRWKALWIVKMWMKSKKKRKKKKIRSSISTML